MHANTQCASISHIHPCGEEADRSEWEKKSGLNKKMFLSSKVKVIGRLARESAVKVGFVYLRHRPLAH